MIDCERHIIAPTIDALYPYMEEAWAHRLSMSEFQLPSGHPHPGVGFDPGLAAALADPAAAAAALPSSVEVAILCPTQGLPAPGWLDHVSAAVFVAALNDYVAEAWLPADARFRQAIALAPNSGELAAAEVRRQAPRPEVVAAFMSPAGTNMGDVHYHPIYEALAAAGLPLIVHPSGVEGTVQGGPTLAAGGPYTPEETLTLLPQVAIANLASLIFEGVFERFPGLRVVFAGFGFDWAPPVLWRMDAEWRALRIEVPWVRKAPSAYVTEHVRFVVDAASGLPQHPSLWDIAQTLSADVPLWGSDSPFSVTPDGDAVLCDVPATLRDRLSHENALATFPRLQHAKVQA